MQQIIKIMQHIIARMQLNVMCFSYTDRDAIFGEWLIPMFTPIHCLDTKIDYYILSF